MYDLPTVLNGLAVRMKAFGMIVIGRQDQLCCLSNYNPASTDQKPASSLRTEQPNPASCLRRKF